MARYLRHLATAVLLFAALFTAGNWLIDPYGIYASPRLEHVNTLKPRQAKQQRIYKIAGLARRPTRVAILGTSRTDRGIDPQHPALADPESPALAGPASPSATAPTNPAPGGAGSYNFAYDRQTLDETRALFDYLAARNHLRTVVLGLDFFAANAHLPAMSDKDAANFLPWRPLQLLVSSTTTSDTLRSAFRRTPKARDTAYTATGLRTGFREAIRAEQGHRGSFFASDRYYFEALYLPTPTCRFAFHDPKTGSAPLDELRLLLRSAARRGIDLHLFISPSHARQWETLAAAGLWARWEDWKRMLVTINAEEAAAAGRAPFPLWDFSGYNSVTREAVPAAGDRDSVMVGYYDSSHYTPATGHLVLDRLFGTAAGRPLPADFGVRLSAENIAGHLAAIRTARTAYRAQFPQEAAEVEGIARSVAAGRHCP